MWSWWLAGGAFAGSWVVDGTSLGIHRGRQPVASAVTCPRPPISAPRLEGRALQVLGIAAVGYSKKQGTMTWGHAALRAIYCHGGELIDVEYESYRLSGWNESQLRREHAGEGFAEGPWLSTQRGALVLFRNLSPVDAGWYAESQGNNREIYEVWLGLGQGERDEVVLAAQRAYREQLALLRAHSPLPVRYRALSDNCTLVFREFLPGSLIQGAPITPFAWLRRLEERAVLQVIHPSHHLIRRWGGVLPGAVPRPHPLIRGPARLQRDHIGRLHRVLSDQQPRLPPAVLRGVGSSPGAQGRAALE